MRPVDRATRRHLIDTISSRGRRPRDSIALQEYSENFETKMVRRMHTPPTNHHTSEEKMVQALENLVVADGDPVKTEHIATALTAGRFAYDDGATQTFEPGGATTYVEHQRRSLGEWYVDNEGRFCSFWPPSYRACYDLHWIVENGSVVGLRFTELDRGSVFVGRYR